VPDRRPRLSSLAEKRIADNTRVLLLARERAVCRPAHADAREVEHARESKFRRDATRTGALTARGTIPRPTLLSRRGNVRLPAASGDEVSGDQPEDDSTRPRPRRRRGSVTRVPISGSGNRGRQTAHHLAPTLRARERFARRGRSKESEEREGRAKSYASDRSGEGSGERARRESKRTREGGRERVTGRRRGEVGRGRRRSREGVRWERWRKDDRGRGRLREGSGPSKCLVSYHPVVQGIAYECRAIERSVCDPRRRPARTSWRRSRVDCDSGRAAASASEPRSNT